MTSQVRQTLELLAPAKNADFGIEAINHGADAVYIGGPAFGARSAAGNSVADIERLSTHAHRFGAQVFVAINTLLHDHELESARALAWDVYHAGGDALIIQDMGLLELDLPPMALHASTQTDNRSSDKVRFLEQVGFSQIVLARELSLAHIRTIAAETQAKLEFFVHGALCVAFSGQCYISHAHTGRSANRGECSQACRLPYSLADSAGQIIAHDQHLLSIKDNNQSANLALLADAGIRSFKIEGRLKDLGYVKNITAHYRQLLDQIIDGEARYQRASVGRCTYTFTPRPEKTFNRGATDYFVNDRHHGIEAFDSPKFTGEPIGRLTRVDTAGKWFEIEAASPLNNGDGLCYYTPKSALQGLRINRVEGARVYTHELIPSELVSGTTLFRNHDQAFVRALEKPSATRQIRVVMRFFETPSGFALGLDDETGVRSETVLAQEKIPAQNGERALASLREHLGKLGNTIFTVTDIHLELGQPWFLPAATINGLRRTAIAQHETARLAAHLRPSRALPADPPPRYPDTAMTYLGNVLNAAARQFYARHGVEVIESGYEANQTLGEVALMITKHCLRYSFNLCPKEVKGIRPDPLTLINGREKLTLTFDCKRCEMQVMGQMKAHILQSFDIPATPVVFYPSVKDAP